MSLFWETRRACFSIAEVGLSVKQNRLDFSRSNIFIFRNKIRFKIFSGKN